MTFKKETVLVEKDVYVWDDDQSVDSQSNAWDGRLLPLIFPVIFWVIMLIVWASN